MFMTNDYIVTLTFKVSADSKSDVVDFAHDLSRYGKDKSYVGVNDVDIDVTN
jgi:hypothetical protein